MTISKSSLPYRRLKYVRTRSRELPDLAETAHPRYEKLVNLTHRRGQKREDKWMKYG